MTLASDEYGRFVAPCYQFHVPEGGQGMALNIRKLTGHFGAEVLDIDLSEPMSDATFAAVSAAFDEHS